MYLQDCLASDDVGCADIDLPVKASRAQKRIVQDILAVGRGDDDNAFVRAKAVHLNEQLVERLLALIVPAAQAGAALAADRIDLIDKHDGRRILLGLLKQVTHARGAHADIQLDKVRTGNRQKGDAGLARNRLGDERLARARRADQQDAFGDARADVDEFFRVLEEFYDLLQLGLFLVCARHIGKGDLFLVIACHLDARAAKLHGIAAAPILLVHHEIPQQAKQDEHDEIGHKACPPRHLNRLVGVLLEDAGVLLLADQVAEVGIEDVQIGHFGRDPGVARVVEHHGQRTVIVVKRLDPFLLKQGHDIGIRHLLAPVPHAQHIADRTEQQENND